MKTINATEIKKRGISVVDEILETQDSVSVIHRSKIKYVVVEKETYDELVGESNVNYRANNVRKNKMPLYHENNDKNEVKDYEEKLWDYAAATSPAFNFLNDPEEDIYTLEDGEPFND